MAILALACVLPAVSAGAQGPALLSPTAPPPAPQISPAEGAAAVGLARQAMLDYLKTRAGTEAVAIPAAAEPLLLKTATAAVTLRTGGEQIAVAIRQEKDAARSIIAAAQAAMRSPKLPDQMTAEYLAGLVVEVEVLSAPRKVEEADLAATIVPGLLGVTASRGLDDFTMLPAASYVGSLPADEVRRECLAGLPLTAANASLAVRWALFSASHHVGYPGGRVLWLVQGREPMPPEMIDAKALSAAAEDIGVFLLRNQDAKGQLKLPAGNADAMDQLYATFALARLAKATGRKDFASGLNAALAWAVQRVRQEPAYAEVVGVEDARQLSAASLLVLAIGEMPANPQGEQLCRKLLATVDKALALASTKQSEAGSVAGSRPADSEKAGLATPRRSEGGMLPLDGLALAYMASARAEPNDTRRLEAIRKNIASAPSGGGSAVCWLIRAGLIKARNSNAPATAPSPSPAGGFVLGRELPDTAVTALAAVNVSAGWTWPALALPGPAAEADKAKRAMILSAKRFCCQMQYRPFEAYFAAKPELWVGGVRASPQGARITLEACAAAIEALLAE
jgi:AMMECR1 domain-containing protein